MKNSMILISNNGLGKVHIICPCCKWSSDNYKNGSAFCNAVIPHFYSAEHAQQSGWRYTNDPKYSPRAAMSNCIEGDWICPDCWPGDAK